MRKYYIFVLLTLIVFNSCDLRVFDFPGGIIYISPLYRGKGTIDSPFGSITEAQSISWYLTSPVHSIYAEKGEYIQEYSNTVVYAYEGMTNINIVGGWNSTFSSRDGYSKFTNTIDIGSTIYFSGILFVAPATINPFNISNMTFSNCVFVSDDFGTNIFHTNTFSGSLSFQDCQFLNTTNNPF